MLTVVGLRQRMVFDSTPTRVIASLVEEGFAVHVYIRMAEKNDTVTLKPERSHGRELPHIGNLTHALLQDYYKDLILEQGGCLVSFHVGPKELIPPIPDRSPFTTRMAQWNPTRTAVGRNVLRLWQARKYVWDHAQEVEQKYSFRYAFAMWTRDDSRWVGKLRFLMPYLDEPDRCSRCVISKDCKNFRGINDKVVIMGRSAASVMYSAYDAYMMPDEAPLDSYTAEEFLKKLAKWKGLDMHKLRHSEVPSGVAMYVGEEGREGYCFFKMYWCGGKAVTFCEDLHSSKSKRQRHGYV